MMKVKNCEECLKEFEYEPPKGFPDKRKYCRVCSEKKKQQWDSKGEDPVEKPGIAWAKPGTVTGETTFTTSTGTDTIVKPKEKEFHLSPEEVKCRALECAMDWGKYTGMTDEGIMNQADKFVKWIYGISK